MFYFRGSKHRICKIVLCLMVISSMTACQKSPESSLVINKDFDRLIDEAKTPGTDKVDINDIAGVDYGSYVTSIEDVDLGVKVTADARVDIPKTDRLSIFRVRQKKFDQDFVDKVLSILTKDAALYDGSALTVRTKGFIEREIAYLRQLINATEDDEIRAEYQGLIDDLKAEYESASSEIELKNYPSDGKLHTTKEMTEQNPGNDFYEKSYILSPNGDILSAVTDGEDGNFSSINVCNSEKTGNFFEFTTNKLGHFGGASDGFVDTDGIRSDEYTEEKPEDYVGQDVMLSGGEPVKYYSLAGESLTVGLDDAIDEADAMLDALGMSEFKYYEGRAVSDYFCETEGGIICRRFFRLTYYRNIDGTFLTQSSGTKNNMSSGYDAQKYGKITWPGESITVGVNDDGIVEFTYTAPIEITETVVEDAAIKSFENARDTFEKMVIVTNAGTYTKKVFDIDRVRLSYSRISEADSYDTGLIVPVWDFYGYYECASDGIIINSGNVTALAVNAVDGSIIDPDLGY